MHIRTSHSRRPAGHRRRAGHALLSAMPAALLALAAGSVACGGGDAPLGPDGPRAVDPTPGGGGSGGQLGTELTVFALSPEAAPIAGAYVLIEPDAGAAHTRTDDQGRADFSGASVAGLRAVHVFAEGRRTTSLIGARSSVLTLVLPPADDPPARAPTMAVLRGQVLGFDRLAPVTPERARIAEIVPAAGMSFAQRPRAGTVTPDDPDGVAANLALSGQDPFPDWRDYELRLDAGDQVLVAWGGSYTLGATKAIEHTHIGVRRGLHPEGGTTQEGQDVELTHALDHRLTAQVPGAPALTTHSVRFGLALADGTVVALEEVPLESGSAQALAPGLEASLADASYLAELHYTSSRLVGSAPRQEVRARALSRETELPFYPPLAAPGPVTAAARSLASSPSRGASLHQWTLYDEQKKRSEWSVWVVGDETAALTLPATPEGFPEALSGARLCTVHAYDLGGADPELGLADLEARARSVATVRSRVAF